ncbi:NDR1/HIN1-like protein 13 [Phragmites australis]|uniref:NDR1/HIN1-like protein 13 n=1 Tax=Phragmites australis TaxID=29695 RepID=UPI002D77301C|nr:NDR1/HIN1-like protein 13 [Phragmites australis]
MGTPYHLQSPRTIVTKIINMKQQPPALPSPPPTAPSKIILQPRHRTSPAMWCAAIVCFAFSILVIVAGVVILIVFLAVKPRAPSFEAANASLNSVYVDSPAYFNGDMTIVANISNPNQKIDVVFRSATVELFFRDRPMAAQELPPFMQRRGQSRVLNMHMVSSRVLLPPEVAVELVNQVRSNRVVYTIRGAFKVEARFWSGHYTYWMHAICELELTAPPSGVLVARRCRKN